jgi:hypothetical protein
MGIRPGVTPLLAYRSGDLRVPAALVPRDQLWFHHPQMQRRIREAEAALVAGRVEKTRSAKAAQALLDARKGKPRRSPQ